MAYHSECKTVLGGHNPSAMPQSAMESAPVDSVLNGKKGSQKLRVLVIFIRAYHWLLIIAQKITKYYKEYGLLLTIIHYLKSTIYKRSSTKIFYEIELNYIIYPRLEDNIKYETVKIINENLEALDYDDRCEMKKDEVRARLGLGYALFGAIKGNAIISQQWIEFKEANLWFLGLTVCLTDRTAYISHLYTSPEYRNKGIASQIELHSLRYLKDSGYKQAIAVVEEGNVSAQTLYENFGFYPYQSVIYRRFLILLTYSTVKEYDTENKKRFMYFWLFRKKDKELLNIFSKIIDK